ncbi:hypothetical protein ACA910_005127 [Epithemia clementina (nom. ined.)]
MSATAVKFPRENKRSCFKCVATTACEQRPVKRRRVQFGQSTCLPEREKVVVSREELQLLWYSRGDLRNFKLSAKNFCAVIDVENELFQAYSTDDLPMASSANERMIATKASFLSGSEAFQRQRGLERWSSSLHMLSRCIAIISVRTEVLLEQSSQSITGKTDPERIAAIYQSASSQSVHYALVLGLADAACLRERNHFGDDFSLDNGI